MCAAGAGHFSSVVDVPYQLGSISSPIQEGDIKAVTERLDRLVEKINTSIQSNFIVRKYLKSDLSSLTKEKLISWISDPIKRFQDLAEKPEHRFAIPADVDELFQGLKTALGVCVGNIEKDPLTRIFQPEKIERKYSSLISLISQKSELIHSGLEDYSWLPCKMLPSEDLKRGLKTLLSQNKVQELDSEALNKKMEQLFILMEDKGHASAISSGLQSIFGLDLNSNTRSIAYDLQTGNPFNRTLVELLLDNPSDAIGFTLCFFDRDKLKIMKIKDIQSVSVAQSMSKFIIKNDEEEVVIRVDSFTRSIVHIEWKFPVRTTLRVFLTKLDPFSSAICKIDPLQDDPYGCQSWLPSGEYRVESLPEENPPLLQKLENEVKNVVRQRKYTKELNFIPIDKSLESIVIKFYSGEENSTYFIITKGGISKEFSIDFQCVCNNFFVQFQETLDEKIEPKEQNKIYLSQTEPLTGEKLAEKLRRRGIAEKEAIDFLKKEDLNPIFSYLIDQWRDKKDFFLDHPILADLIRKVTSSEVKQQLLVLYEIDEIRLGSREAFNLTLVLILRANLEQMVPNLNLSKNTDLIDMLGDSLEKSKHLERKRGMLLFGETGAGKSATTAFLIGALLEEYKNRFGEACVRVDENWKKKSISSIPEVGFDLGISKTTFVESYDLISTEESVSQGRDVEIVKVHFPPLVKSEQFSIIDCPGFYDTRKTNYEITTSFSIDHSILNLRKIDAIAQVIPYNLLVSSRGIYFVKALKELSNRFPNCFSDPILSKKFFFLITKQDQAIGVKALQERALQLLEEEKNSSSPDLDKCLLLKFFAKQCQEGRVFTILPTTPTQRIDILNKVLQDATPMDQKDDLKEHYQMALDSSQKKNDFTDIVDKAIGIWIGAAFPNFLEDSKTRIEEKMEQMKKIEENKRDFNLKIDLHNKKVLDLIARKRDLEGKLKNCSASPESQEMWLKEFEKNKTARCTDIENEINQFEKEEEKLLAQLKELQDVFNKKQDENSRLISEIQEMKNWIEENTTGSYSQDLHKKEHTDDSPIPVRTYHAHIDLKAKTRRAIDKGEADVSDHEGEYALNERRPNEKFNLNVIANIDREYHLLPPGQDEMNAAALNQLISGEKTVVLDRGNYRIDIVSNKIQFEYIRHHRDGRQICYGYVAKFDGQAPLPSLTITHIIPKAGFNREEIRGREIKIFNLNGKVNACQEALGRLEEEIKYANGRLDETRKGLLARRNELQKLKLIVHKETSFSILDRLSKLIDENQHEQNRLSGQIDFFKFEIKILEDSASVRKTELQKLEFIRKRWALFIRSHNTHLKNALKMAKYFIAFKKKWTTDLPLYVKKWSEVSERCENFLRFYEENKGLIKKELADLGFPKREIFA